ncbi:hypothetical protein OA88_20935, partial [Flavobacterium sp. JRM]
MVQHKALRTLRFYVTIHEKKLCALCGKNLLDVEMKFNRRVYKVFAESAKLIQHKALRTLRFYVTIHEKKLCALCGKNLLDVEMKFNRRVYKVFAESAKLCELCVFIK